MDYGLILSDLFISDLFISAGSVVDARFHVGDEISLRSVETRAPAHCVDGLEAGGGDEPRTGIVRDTDPRPGLQSGGEGLMHRLFGEIEIAEEARKRSQNPARFQPVKGLNGPAELFGLRRGHLRQASKRNGSIQLRSGFRNPALFLESGKVHLFYTVCVEQGVGGAEITLR